MLDGHDIADLEQRLLGALEELRQRTEAVAQAKQIKEFVGDLRKNLLARYKLPFVREGLPDTKADTLARADENYQAELSQLQAQYQTAEKHCTAFDVSMAKFDAARSLLSMAKAQMPATHQGNRQT